MTDDPLCLLVGEMPISTVNLDDGGMEMEARQRTWCSEKMGEVGQEVGSLQCARADHLT
jgi:hypothetical protein